MPMPGDYNWRPNDNSSQTNLRYDLEAQKWITAVGNAKSKLKKPTIGSFMGDLGAIGLFLTIPLLIFGWLFLIPIWLIREVVGYNIKIFPGDPETGWIEKDSMARYRVDHSKFPKKKKEPNIEMPSEEHLREMAKFIYAENRKNEMPKFPINFED